MSEIKLTPNEEKFCLVYVCGPAPYNGNAQKTYELVFRERVRPTKVVAIQENVEANNTILEVEDSLQVRKLMAREEIKERIAQLQSESLVNASTLAPRLTASLLKIVDECSTLQVEDRWGTVVSPAALRSVAVNAASKLMEMYGIKEDIAHKVVLEGADGDGITFNLVVPDSNKDNDIAQLID